MTSGIELKMMVVTDEVLDAGTPEPNKNCGRGEAINGIILL